MTREEFDNKLKYLKARRKDLHESLDKAMQSHNWDEIDHYENLLQINNHDMAQLRLDFMWGN